MRACFALFASMVCVSAFGPAAYKATSTQEAWDNHFAGFGGQDLDVIMRDYKEESVVRFFQVGGELAIFAGLAEIRGMFVSLFASLSDLSTLTAPVADVQDGMVFLIWEAPGMGYLHVTDSFLFDEQHLIHRQNIVAHMDEGARRRLLQAYAPKTTADAWANHFDAFGAQDLDKIMLDYDANSEVRLYNYAAPGEATLFTGLEAIRGMFAALFADLADLSSLAAPVVEQEEGMVFLVWETPEMGYTWATDTFSFDENQKIRYQNIAALIEK